MTDRCFVGFDTSNYTTSCAVVGIDGAVLANIKLPLPVADGGRGLRQSDAVFSHIRHLPEVMRSASAAISEMRVAAVGYSARPRDVKDSYMPCFLAGECAAKCFAAGADVPNFSFSHQAGHIKAAYHSSGAALDGDFAAFHVSGGTTELLYVGRNGAGTEISLLGGTSDLNAGQAVDRIGVHMGLKFPCGAEMDALALNNRVDVPKPKISVNRLECNLSGLENKAIELYNRTGDSSLTSAYALEWVARTLAAITDNLREIYTDIPVIYAGGVMGSRYIRERLDRRDAYFAEPAMSSDNAVGIALLTRDKFLESYEKL